MKKTVLILFVTLIFILAACGGKEADIPADASEETMREATAVPEPTDEPEPTNEPEPTATAEPTAVPEVTVELAEIIRNEKRGYAFNPPAGWEVDEDSESAFMLAPGADESAGPLIGLLIQREDETLTLEETLTAYVDNIFGEDDDLTIGEPVDLTIGGIAARQVDITGSLDEENNTEGVIRLTAVIPAEGQSFLILGAASVEQWDETVPVYEAVRNSINFFEPEVVSFETPDGFLWRGGGESGISEGQFGSLGGVVVDSNDYIYVTDNLNGVIVFNAAGEMVNNYDLDEFRSPDDVAVDNNGNIIVSDWASDAIYVLDTDGNLITQFGSEGNSPGQFGSFSPEAVTVDAAGNIYVLDNNETDAGDKFTRVEVFDSSGSFLYEFPVEMDFFSGQDIAYWPGGDTLYVISFTSDDILEYDLQGNLLRQIPAFDFSGAQAIDLDAAGNIYAAIWTPDGVVKFDHDGNLLASWGVGVEDGDIAWPEGGVYQAAGVGVNQDGTLTAVSDWSGDYSYLTVFTFP